jgi:hypothetical protein
VQANKEAIQQQKAGTKSQPVSRRQKPQRVQHSDRLFKFATNGKREKANRKRHSCEFKRNTKIRANELGR